jgi:predicted transcriptional regulator YdeE
MIESLSYTNIRQGSRTFRFGKENVIGGPNGIGKTTIGDALSFAFTGCDSTGKPLPVHMIQEGKDKMSVRVDTGKAVLERTLTEKKSSTIKFTRTDQPSITLTQTELAAMMCSRDCFLAASVAGWFMAQSVETKSKVLSEFVPPVNKRELVERLIGGPIPQFLSDAMTFTKKTDNIIQRVAQIRLDVQRKADRISGELNQLSTVEKPEPTKDLPESMEELKSRRKAWDVYRADIAAWKLAWAQMSVYEQQVKELKSQIDAIVVPEEAVPEDVNDQIDELRKQLTQLPARPAIMSLPSQEVCGTCGQTVGLKHRESMKERNDQLINEWKEATRLIAEKNAEIDEKVKALHVLKGEYHACYVKKGNTRTKLFNQKRDLEIKLAKMQPPAFPNDKIPPGTPDCEDVSEEEYQDKTLEYKRVLAWNAVMADRKIQWDKAQVAIAVKNAELDKEAGIIGLIMKVESALKHLDETVFRMNEPHYQLRDGYRLIVEDENITVVDQDSKTYSFMSTGERIRADAYICEKIANSLPRKVKYVFVDNRDLVSGSLSLDVEQVFFTQVEDGPTLRVTVDGEICTIG